jgi:hypothetical protein
MKVLRVTDVDFDSIRQEKYDVSLFASGYEARAIHVAGMLRRQLITHPLVFGFTEEPHAGNRDANDRFYEEYWKQAPIPMSGDDEKPIYEHLDHCARAVEGTIRIVLDYSSMSRLWYAAVLNWARFAAKREVCVDFVYSMGRYEEEKRPMVIRQIVSVPGCEGRAYHLRECVAVFGLGFHGAAAMCVLDRLEASVVYAFLAAPGSSPEYVERTRKCNKDLLDDVRRKKQPILELPLSSIEKSYRNLAELISYHRSDGEITVVPMGPKPHVLASILVAMRFPEVACLRVAGMPYPVDVKPTGEIVATRVIICGDGESR